MSGSDRIEAQTHSDEDEDLFDFPRMEWTLEGLKDTSFVGATPSSIPQPDQTLASVTAPLPRDSTPQATPVQTLKVEPQGVKLVTPAPPPATAPISHPPADVPRPRRARPALLIGALVVLFALNGVGFWYLWHTRVSLGAGLEGMRTELDDAARRLERARRETAARGGTEVPADEPVELERIRALERSSIVVAENEIEEGEYAAARRRLQGLLARADSIPSSLRAEIEPRATFLIARSYLDEARARRGEKP